MTQGKAKHAMSLISYNPFYEKSIKSVFADVLICDDADTAKKLAFDNKVNMKCVTLDGVVYDPEGTVQGGAELKKSMSVLNRISSITQIETDMK